MKAYVSNTGNHITLTLDPELSKRLSTSEERVRIEVYPGERYLSLTPCANGWKLSRQTSNKSKMFLSWPSKRDSKWPLHGIVECDIRLTETTCFVTLPKGELPPPAPRTTRRKRAEMPRPSRTAGSISLTPIIKAKEANVVLSTLGQTLAFHVPQEELLRLTLRYAHAGYALSDGASS